MIRGQRVMQEMRRREKRVGGSLGERAVWVGEVLPSTGAEAKHRPGFKTRDFLGLTGHAGLTKPSLIDP